MEQVIGNTKYQYNHPRKRKTKIQVGQIRWANHPLFKDLIRVEVLKLYENSAMVKIIVCKNAIDDAKQLELRDLTTVRYKDFSREL